MVEAARAPESEPPDCRLAYFAGTWDFCLEMEPGPFGPGGLVTGTDRDELLSGGFQLLRRYETLGPFGRVEGIEILCWDAELGSYFQRGFDGFGRTLLYRGSVAGDTWTWTFEARAGGKDYRARITIREASSSLQTYRSEISEDGESWTTVLEGTLTKRPSPARRSGRAGPQSGAGQVLGRVERRREESGVGRDRGLAHAGFDELEAVLVATRDSALGASVARGDSEGSAREVMPGIGRR
ncbi:MAG: DUF1579 family protein [Thermoanaerobaculia bacterium]